MHILTWYIEHHPVFEPKLRTVHAALWKVAMLKREQLCPVEGRFCKEILLKTDAENRNFPFVYCKRRASFEVRWKYFVLSIKLFLKLSDWKW